MNIYLIGLPGSGKSTLGRELAKKLNYTFLDTDLEICKSENNSIESLFQHAGEAYFRKIEQDTLLELSKKDNQLISTGGGLPCFYDNIDFMNRNGITVYIDVPIETLTVRIATNPINVRPMFKNKSTEEIKDFLTTKFKERDPFYAKAKIRISGSNIKSQEIMDQLNKL